MRVLFFSLVLMVLALPPLVLAPGAGMAQEVSDAPITVDEILKALPFDPDDIDPASIDLEALKQGPASPDRIPEELLDQVFALEEAGRMSAAVRLLLPLASEDNSDAIAELGFFLLYRLKSPETFQIAEGVLNYAIKSKQPIAMLTLGEATLFGDGIPRNERLGRTLLEASAELGNSDAAVQLGAYHWRKGTMQHIQWFARAEELGNIEGSYGLYLAGGTPQPGSMGVGERICLTIWSGLIHQPAIDCQRFR